MTSITLNTSIVINRKYGGFRLSDFVSQELAEQKGVTLSRNNYGFLVVASDCSTAPTHWRGRLIEDCVSRDDPYLLNLVRIWGDKANGDGSDLVVKTVRVTVEIENTDGMERIGNAWVEDR